MSESTVNYQILGKYVHKYFGVELNGLVWRLLDKTDRSPEDEDNMITCAYASLYHWSMVGKPENLQRGEWLISHVYAILNMHSFAFHHASKCLDITEENQLQGFDRAFAFEAMARSSALIKDKERYEIYYQKALETAKTLENEEEKKIVMDTLEDIKEMK